ncbi:MAG: hypothetical protein AAGU12_05195 [Clostridiales bacterium]
MTIIKTENEIEQWQELVHLTREFQALKPWQHLAEMEMITIDLPEASEPVFCCVFGKNTEVQALRVLPGAQALINFYRLAHSLGEDTRRLLYEQKDLRLTFVEGADFVWEARWPGYLPRMLREEEAGFLGRVVKHVNRAIRNYIDGKVNVDFAAGKTLLRYYDGEANMWLTKEEEAYFPPLDYPSLSISEVELVQELQQKPKNKAVLELDMFYLPRPATLSDSEEEGGESGSPAGTAAAGEAGGDGLLFYPRMLLLGDKERGALVNNTMLSPRDNGPSAIFQALADYILSFGRPGTLIVCQEMYFQMLQDFCKGNAIKLELAESGQELTSLLPLREKLLG